MNQFFKLPGVTLFASGVFRGKRWLPLAIRHIAKKARELGPAGAKLLVPPAVLGHEEDQEELERILERTDTPAAGWVNPGTITAVPDPENPGEMLLKGDVVNVPPEVAEKIMSGAFKYGSAEIYNDMVDDFGKSHGHVLRRFAMLGAEIPCVKRLGPLPRPVPMAGPIQFSERRDVRLRERRCSVGITCHTERYRFVVAPKAKAPRMGREERLVAAYAAKNKDAIRKFGKTPEQVVLEFNELRRHKPGLTAEEVFGEGAFTEDMHRFADAGAAGGMGSGGPINRQEVLAALKAAMPNLSQTTFDALSDDQLAELLRALPAQSADATAGAAPAGGGTLMMAADEGAGGGAGENPTREEMITDLVAAGYDQAELEGLSDEELLDAYLSGGEEATDAEVGEYAANTFSEPKPRAAFISTYSQAKRKWGAGQAKKMLLGR